MSAHKYVKIKKRWIVFMNFNGWHGGALCQENEWHKLQQSVNSYNFCNSFIRAGRACVQLDKLLSHTF